MANEADEALITKIEALFAKAEASQFPEERDAFIKGARRLMVAHAIDESVIRERKDRPEPTTEWWTFSADNSRLDGKYAMLSLACEVAGSGTRVALEAYVRGHDGSQRCCFIGFPTEIAVAKIMYTNLMTQAIRDAWNTGWMSEEMVDQFLIGYSSGGMAKIMVAQHDEERRQAHERARSEAEPPDADRGPDTGLVLASRANEVAEWAASHLPIADAGTVRAENTAAARAGFRAGTMADLDTQ